MDSGGARAENSNLILRVLVFGFLYFAIQVAYGQSAGSTQAGAVVVEPNVFVDTGLAFSVDRLGNGSELLVLLQELNVLPDREAPYVLRLRSIDSGFYDIELDGERERWNAIVVAARELGAIEPVLVLSPRNSEEARTQSGRSFPTTPAELDAAGFDWLVEPSDFQLHWDSDGLVAAELASRWLIFGVEQIGTLSMTLCIENGAVAGWARAFHVDQPGRGSIHQFVEDCMNGNLEWHPELIIPQAILDEHGLAGEPFALLQPWFGYEHVAEAVTLAERSLSISNVDIPLRVIATNTISDVTGSDFIPVEDHAGLLSDRGVEVDAELSLAVPSWVEMYATRRATLLLFDESGGLMQSFFVVARAGPHAETLNQALLLRGLF